METDSPPDPSRGDALEPRPGDDASHAGAALQPDAASQPPAGSQPAVAAPTLEVRAKAGGRSDETDRLFRSITFAVLAAFHVVAVAAWLAPWSYTRQQVLRATRRYVLATKSDQAWPMFAPDPLAINRRAIVVATLASGETREVDLTTPLNQAMRGFNFARVGKRLKAHDRVMSGGERQYERGFILHQCAQLAKEWGQPLREIALHRDYDLVELENKTGRTRRTAPPQRALVATHRCPEL